MSTFRLKISTPEGLKFDGDAERIVVRGALGDLAVLAGHVPMMTTVREGICRVVTAEGETRTGSTHGGILTVGKDSVIALLGDWETEKE
ncbi:MAG: F0F1 ATP synthase subunit epsilon [Clostridia bacterium]|nr:F0F1 ATP synthase subunit epsilon [Clostridia bacterium]